MIHIGDIMIQTCLVVYLLFCNTLKLNPHPALLDIMVNDLTDI